jgi:hypothetical protein
VQTFLRRATSRTPFSSELLPVLKLSLLPSLAMAGLNEPGPDFGLWTAVLFGAISGIAAFRPGRSSVKPPRLGSAFTARGVGRGTVGHRAFGWSASRHR